MEHFGIIGLGPVGGTVSCLLASGGKRVSVFDISSHRVDILREHPIKLSGCIEAEAHLIESFCTFSEFAATEPEVVLITVKTYALKDVLDRIACSKLKSKIIVSCQNGIDTEKEIANVLGDEHAYRVILNFGVGYVAANEIKVNFLNPPHYISSVDPAQEAVARKLAEDLCSVRFETEYVEDIAVAAFRKAILNATLCSICSLTRMNMIEVMTHPDLLRMVQEVIREGIAICKASNIDLGDDFYDKALIYLKRGGSHKPTMLVDIEAKRQTEIEHLTGKLFEYAEEHNLESPVMQTLYYLVKSLERSQILSSSIHASYD